MIQKSKNQKILDGKEIIITSGKRKTAVARAILTEGSGKISLNNRNSENLQLFDKLKIEEPIRIAKEILGEDKIHIISAYVYRLSRPEESSK